MNILVIGNGFDLAHGLPTKYTDFLKWVKVIRQIERLGITGDYTKIYNEVQRWYGDEQIDWFVEKFGRILNRTTKEILIYIKNNIWIEYFLEHPKYQKENWIDFEGEISNVIQSLDGDMHGLSGDYSLDDYITNLSNKFLQNKYFKYTSTVRSINALTDGASERITFKEIRNRLLIDLNKLIRALEIYLIEYVGKMEIQKKSLNIGRVEVDHVLSFNYTNTYEKIYGNTKEIEYDYIHGKADINNTIETNNMVLGIDEYLSEDRRNKDIEFIAFKKFYQRIHKETGCKYKEWTDEIKDEYAEYKNRINNAHAQLIESFKDGSILQYPFQKEHFVESLQEECPKHNLYIFGHSLDVTDKDVLRDLILNDNVYTTIFYLNKDVMGQQIANLVKVIGQDELIRRTGGSTKTIEFKQQQDMVAI